jgi:hypothetical protein
MKLGRNDPCPCGSGKKYKKCCLDKQAQPSQALYYRRLSEAHGRLVNRLIPYANRIFGKEAVFLAMQEFLLWPEEEDEIDEDDFERFGPLFWPWFLFNWEYDSIDAEVELPGPEGRTVSELYLEEHESRLDPLERKLIEAINRKPYTFWEVLYVDRGMGMLLQDVLGGSEIEVQERSGSENVQPGDLLFGRAVLVDGVGMIMGFSTTIIPPRRKPEIIELRKELRKDISSVGDDTLYEWDFEIREMYLHIEDSLHALPQLCNTDGDPLEFHHLIFEVSSAQEAFDRLCDLCVTAGPDELLAGAKRDSTGRILRIKFSWDRLGHKADLAMPSTLLGRIVIDGTRLTAEVNSARRAETLRLEIDSRLGSKARFRLDEIQDVRSMMREAHSESQGKTTSAEQEEMMQHPEMRAHLSEIIGRHWEAWIDQEIPALAGKTPKEAVQTPDGREAVEALLKDAERHRGQDPLTEEANRKGTRKVREWLGLNDQ